MYLLDLAVSYLSFCSVPKLHIPIKLLDTKLLRAYITIGYEAATGIQSENLKKDKVGLLLALANLCPLLFMYLFANST